MKIIITTVQIPFVSGGAELLTVSLKKALCMAGNEVEIVTIPFMDNPINLLENHIVASRLLNLERSWGGKIDLCIGLKFPAYYIPHSNKKIWLLHQYRAAYDLYNTEYSNLKSDDEGKRIKKLILNADARYLTEAKKIYTISKNVTNRLKKYNNITSNTLYHPCPDMEYFYSKTYDNYILMPSRINITKRQYLAIEAMKYVKSSIKLVIVGQADHPSEKERLNAFIKEYHLESKISYLDFVLQEKKLELYANARAVLFIPVDEDYGYITLEAMAASKGIITACDSGGPLEFIKHGENGLIVNPNPQSIAKAIDEFSKSLSMAQEYGKQAKIHLAEMDITWDHVVKELT